MNILPLILALALILSVLTVEKLEKYKNQIAIEKHYQQFLKHDERQAFNRRQKNLYGNYKKNIKQLSFRFLVDKKARDANPDVAKQYRLLLTKLMENLYGQASFFLKLKKERGEDFLNEMLDAIEKSSEEALSKTPDLIKKIQHIARLDLGDERLQEAFYFMLKGNISRNQLKKQKKKEIEDGESDLTYKEKGYVSLFEFIDFNGNGKIPRIALRNTPKEILKAIFESDDAVEAYIARRNQLGEEGGGENESVLKEEFKGKLREGITDQIIEFKVTKGDKSEYE